MKFGDSERFTPSLRTEAERQLLVDLRHYGVLQEGLWIDWSSSCQEGHCTRVLDSHVEELSDLVVKDAAGEVVAEGWMDFIHGGGENPLFVFWLFLTIRRGGDELELKDTPTIPSHVWERLPVATKELCLRADTYDARWAKDPLVIKWGRQRG